MKLKHSNGITNSLCNLYDYGWYPSDHAYSSWEAIPYKRDRKKVDIRFVELD